MFLPGHPLRNHHGKLKEEHSCDNQKRGAVDQKPDAGDTLKKHLEAARLQGLKNALEEFYNQKNCTGIRQTLEQIPSEERWNLKTHPASIYDLMTKHGSVDDLQYIVGWGDWGFFKRSPSTRYAHTKGVTTLHKVASGNNPELIHFLTTQPGFDINLTNGVRETPLHYAMRYGDCLPMLKTILDMPGVDVNAKDLEGHTPLFAAFLNKATPTLSEGTLAKVQLLAARPDLDLSVKYRVGDAQVDIITFIKNKMDGNEFPGKYPEALKVLEAAQKKQNAVASHDKERRPGRGRKPSGPII